ncbi:MAG TPA: polyprenyl synthetase family protein [Acidimicrobiia bacterium]|nr:polyprenyl synthetase family protein [Acidimicrobiia bacterium]
MDAPTLEDLVPLPQIWQRLDDVEARLLDVSQSEDEFLTKAAQHLLVAGGKRFRPLLAQLAAEFGPADDRRSIDAAVAVELIHVGSLYHDDVIDEATTRRGTDSANTNWGNTVAILAGDFLMARASEVAAKTLGQRSVEILARTYAELVEGQTRELQLDWDIHHGTDEYFKVIEGKTASLIQTAARLGAMAADASEEDVERVSRWAWELGIVFQITDDALDLVATDAFLGKPAGSDISEGKFTLPVLEALRGPEGTRIGELLTAPRPYPADTVTEVIGLVRAGGYVEEALNEAARRIAVAENSVSELPDSPARAVLKSLGTYLIDRVEVARAMSG